MTELKQHDISLLYVEDEESTREEVQQYLRRRVREVIVARNGEEGLELFRQNAPDVVVTDIRMPVMDGLAMVRSIRTRNRDIPVVVATAYSDTAYMIDAIDVGVDQYVIKPVIAEKLALAVEKCAVIIEYRRAHKRHLAERERLITELQQALAEIKTLRGILPICSYCKKIRDDKGAWKQLESYISEHTDALFSHGLCDECAKQHYPEYYEK